MFNLLQYPYCIVKISSLYLNPSSGCRQISKQKVPGPNILGKRTQSHLIKPIMYNDHPLCPFNHLLSTGVIMENLYIDSKLIQVNIVLFQAFHCLVHIIRRTYNYYLYCINYIGHAFHHLRHRFNLGCKISHNNKNVDLDTACQATLSHYFKPFLPIYDDTNNTMCNNSVISFFSAYHV